jgi:effector-binding domain-containing protein
MKYLLILLLILIIWTLWGYFSSNVEQARYSVIKKTSDYEIREYSAHIEAQTTVQGSYETALNQGFRIVAGYIFGGNVKKQSIAMTAPVVEKKTAMSQSEKIAMTAPVTVSDSGEMHTISFVMPSSYTLESLPTPNDIRVKLIEIQAQKVATIQFSWYRTTARVLSLQKQLLANLARDGVTVVGQPSYAGYNAPWTPPWLIRNEVLVQIK